MVDHLTQVTALGDPARLAAMEGALTARGFAVSVERRRLVATSSEVEAHEAKRHLRSLGFADREYRVYLEYVRQWGIL